MRKASDILERCYDQESVVVERLAKESIHEEDSMNDRSKVAIPCDPKGDKYETSEESTIEALRHFDALISELRRCILLADKELQTTLNELSSRLPNVEEALEAQARGLESSCSIFIKMMSDGIEKGHVSLTDMVIV